MEQYEKKFRQFLTEGISFPTQGGEILSNIENSGKFEQWYDEEAQYDDAHYKNIPLEYFLKVTGWSLDQIKNLDMKGFQDYEGGLIFDEENQTISITGGA